MITNIRRVEIERFSIISSERFEEVVQRIEESVAHPNADHLQKDLARTRTFSEVQDVVRTAVNSHHLLEFTRFDLGTVLRTRPESRNKKMIRLVLGNPIVLQEIAAHVPDTASYVPVSIMIDDRQDGVHLSYDRLSSLLAPYGNDEAIKIARGVDHVVEDLLINAAKSQRKIA